MRSSSCLFGDLLEEFLDAFQLSFRLWLMVTTDIEEEANIEQIFSNRAEDDGCGDFWKYWTRCVAIVAPKEQLSLLWLCRPFPYQEIKEADFWAGESWQRIDRVLVKDWLIKSSQYGSQSKKSESLSGDIPTFFRYNRIVVAWNEALISPEMNKL